jgi:hypothetical protein
MSVFARRFGSLFNAFKMIGYFGRSKYPASQERFRRRHLRSGLMEVVKDAITSAGLSVEVNPTASWFSVGGKLTCSLQLMRYCDKPRGPRWYRTHQSCIGKLIGSASLHILARLNPDQCTIRDCYLVPREFYNSTPLAFRVRNSPTVNRYRFAGLMAVTRHLIDKANEPQRFRSLTLL